MRARRIGIVVVLALLGIVLLAGIAVPRAISTPALKSRVLAVTSRAAGREVGASRVRVAPFFRSVRLDDFTLAQPEGFPEGHALEADRVSLEMGIRRLLRGEVVGTLDGEGVRANLLRRGERTSFDGLGGAGAAEEKAREKKEGIHVDLDVKLADGRLVVKNLDTKETLTLDGVGLRTHLDTAAGAAMPVTLDVRRIRRGALAFDDVRIEAVQRGDAWSIEDLSAALPGGGTLAGSGRFDLTKGWQLALDARDVDLHSDLRPIVAALLPVLAAPGGDLAGRLDGSFDLRADGLTWAHVRRSLRGGGEASVTNVETAPAAVIGQIASLAGFDASAARVRDAAAAFRIEDGWIRFQRLSAHLGDVPVNLEGRVSLDGRLDLTTDLAPLARRTGRGPLQEVAGRTGSLPVRIRGTVTAPEVAPPRPEELPPELQKRAREALKDLFRRRTDAGAPM